MCAALMRCRWAARQTLVMTQVHVKYMTDMRKGADALTLSAEILINCGKFMLEALHFSLVLFLMLKCYGTFTYIMKYFHSNAQLTLIKGVFSDKLLLIAEMLYFPETFPKKFLNFSHVCCSSWETQWPLFMAIFFFFSVFWFILFSPRWV